MKRVVGLLRVILSVGKVEFGVCMGGMVVVGGVLAGGLGLGDTVEGLVSVLIGLLHLGRCLGVGIVVGLSEGGIVVVGGNAGINLTGYIPPPPGLTTWPLIFSVKIPAPGTVFSAKLWPPGRKNETKSPTLGITSLVRMSIINEKGT